MTRTLHLREPSAWQRECFTRVLRGHIALDSATFPDGTPGMALDALARTALWAVGLDYGHGTGHGVGAALNVHEGPQSISPRYGNTVGLREGMVCSNEPGYYQTGAFGIRIENLLVVRRRQTAHQMAGRSFLGFDQLTHVPIQARSLPSRAGGATEPLGRSDPGGATTREAPIPTTPVRPPRPSPGPAGPPAPNPAYSDVPDRPVHLLCGRPRVARRLPRARVGARLAVAARGLGGERLAPPRHHAHPTLREPCGAARTRRRRRLTLRGVLMGGGLFVSVAESGRLEEGRRSAAGVAQTAASAYLLRPPFAGGALSTASETHHQGPDLFSLGPWPM